MANDITMMSVGFQWNRHLGMVIRQKLLLISKSLTSKKFYTNEFLAIISYIPY